MQICERVLLTWAVEGLKDFPFSPITTGIGFTDQQSRLFTDEVRDKFDDRPFSESDISGWDRIVAYWMMMLALYLLFLLIPHPEDYKILRRGLEVWILLSTNPLYIIGAILWYQMFVGRMPSGSFLTTLWNGLMRLLIAALCSAWYAKVAGDDCLEGSDDVDATLARYASLGIQVREFQIATPDHFSFCSHEFITTGDVLRVELQTWPKAMFKFLTSRVKTYEQVAALRYEFRGLRGVKAKHINDILDEWEDGIEASQKISSIPDDDLCL